MQFPAQTFGRDKSCKLITCTTPARVPCLRHRTAPTQWCACYRTISIHYRLRLDTLPRQCWFVMAQFSCVSLIQLFHVFSYQRIELLLKKIVMDVLNSRNKMMMIMIFCFDDLAINQFYRLLNWWSDDKLLAAGSLKQVK